MNASPDDGRGTEMPARGSRRAADPSATSSTARAAPRAVQDIHRYMVAPTHPGMTTAAFTQQLRDLGITEIVRTLEPRGRELPAVAVVQATAKVVAALRRAATPSTTAFLIERDRPL